MAKYNYENYEKSSAAESTQKSKVGYFNSLKDDGDEAVVRFIYTSPNEFDIVTVHNVQVGDRWRRVSCLREGYDPLEKCPLCQKGNSVGVKFYVKLLEYYTKEDGTIGAQAKVWERPASFAKLLKSYIDEGYNLSECIFKIKRRGAKGSLQTKYDVMYANPQIYKPEIYVKDFSDFEGFDLSHHSYYEKTFEELATFVATGEFGQSAQSQPVTPQPTQPVQSPSPAYGYGVYQPSVTTPVYQQPSGVYQQPVAPQPAPGPAVVTTPGVMYNTPTPAPVQNPAVPGQPAPGAVAQPGVDNTNSRPKRTYQF